LRNLVVAAILRHCDERVQEGMSFICGIERAMLYQIADEVEMAFADREV
jgi:hypothetical protein